MTVSDEVNEELDRVLQSFNLQPVQVKKEENSGSQSLLNNQILERFPLSERLNVSSIIQWVPPIPNWNPWIGSNIDEGPLSTATMESISEDLFRSEQFHLDNDRKDRVEHRQHLPVFRYRQEILRQIQEHNVILIRGATGCGKTTQVCLLLSNRIAMREMFF